MSPGKFGQRGRERVWTSTFSGNSNETFHESHFGLNLSSVYLYVIAIGNLLLLKETQLMSNNRCRLCMTWVQVRWRGSLEMINNRQRGRV